MLIRTFLNRLKFFMEIFSILVFIICVYLVCTYVYMYVYICMYVCMCSMYVCSMYVCMQYVCTYVCIEECMHVCTPSSFYNLYVEAHVITEAYAHTTIST